jgi:hypothetical protein
MKAPAQGPGAHYAWRVAAHQHSPAPLPDWQIDQIRNHALTVHRAVSAHCISRVDFMISGVAPQLEDQPPPGLSRQGNLATTARPPT